MTVQDLHAKWHEKTNLWWEKAEKVLALELERDEGKSQNFIAAVKEWGTAWIQVQESFFAWRSAWAEPEEQEKHSLGTAEEADETVQKKWKVLLLASEVVDMTGTVHDAAMVKLRKAEAEWQEAYQAARVRNRKNRKNQ
jgi:hypothetical protein